MERKNPFFAFLRSSFPNFGASAYKKPVNGKAGIVSFHAVPGIIREWGIVCVAMVSFSLVSWGQVDGDYQTRATGIWSANTTWQVRSGGAWVDCAIGDYPGVTAGAANVTVLNGNTVTLTTGSPVTVNGNLDIVAGAILTYDAAIARTLNVAGNLSGGGTIDLSPGNLSHTLNLGGATNTLGVLTTSPTSASVINYNRTGNQTVFVSPDYRNLTFSNSGIKLISGDLTVAGNMTINNTASLSVSANINFSGTNFTVNSTASSAFNATAGSFTFTGGNQSVSNVAGSGSVSFFNLTLGGTLVKTVNQSFTVTNDLSVNNLVTLDLGNFATTINVLGNMTIDGTLDFGTLVAKTFNLTGNIIDVSGVITMNGAGLAHNLSLGGVNNAITTLNSAAAGTINYTRTGDQQVFGSPGYQNINISGGGIKTLQAGSTVNGILTLTNGILRLGSSNLTISNNATTSIQGSFSATNMIETDGTGALIRIANTILPISFPVGSGGYYSPVSISAISTTTGTVSVRAVYDPTLGANFVNKYWDIVTSTGGKTITATFTYDPAEISIYPTNIWYKPGAGNWLVPAGASTFGANSFTITGTTDMTTSSTFWTAGALATFYSYQTGDWNTPNTWTTDPSGTLQVGNTVPGLNDKVIILTGRTVSLSSDITTQGLDITIDAGGFLNLTDKKFSSSLSALRGQGTLQLASVDFPTATINTFLIAGGGTTEYNNAINFTLPVAQTTYNNLTINAPGTVATQLSDLTLFGNLHVKSGTYRINDNISAVKLNLTINGDVTVDNGAFITVGNGVTNPVIGAVTSGGVAPFINYYTYFHTVIIKGNFSNNGTVRFTNLLYPVYNAFPLTVAGATTGAASVYFQGATDNILTCNGTTDFYNLILDKGTDQTYKLTVNSIDYNKFRLFGANTLAGEAAGSNPNLRKALWIRTGTLVLEGSLIIPSLTEGTTAGPPNSDYYIPSNGALELNGVDVVVFSTADDYREINTAYGVSAADNATIGISAGGNSALDVYGKLQINDGYLSTRESEGIITSSVASGQIIINGGTADAKQFLSSTGAAQFTQTGGTFILRGRFQRTPAAFATIADLKDVSLATLNTTRALNGINPAFGTFNLENPANIFTMSGGTIRIYDVCGIAAGEQKAFDVKSSAANLNVSGGTLEIIPVTGSGSDAGNYSIFTNAPLNNFIINRASSTSVVRLNTQLIILNDFSLISGDFSANDFNVSIGGDFTIETGTAYTTPVTNTTILNGTANQIFTVNLASGLSLNNLTIDKPAGVDLEFAGTQKTINITDNFRLVAGTLKDNGNTINVFKDVFNSGLHTGTGKIAFTGTVAQQIDGNGIFNNVELNNNTAVTAPVSLAANMTVNGILTFSRDKLFNIGIYNLKLNSSASIANASATRYFQTAGNAGDGGLTKVYSSTTAFLFPVGAPTLVPVRAVKYTPAAIGFTSAPAVYGSITVIPVGYEHPATSVKGQSLTYFWHINSSGFSGISLNSVTHTFVYDQSDVAGTEVDYIPSLYNRISYSWNNGLAADINTATNTISDWISPTNSKNSLDGDYTAGDNTPVSPFGTPTVYYSRINGTGSGSGLWSDVNTWSTDPVLKHTGAAAASVPGISDIVIIGARDSVYLGTDNLVPNTDVRSCASLQIEKGSALDIGYNYDSSFGMVLSHAAGNGNFRLTTSWNSVSTYTFPSGDFTNFNVNLGTTELYSTNPAAGTTYYLPNGVLSYGNLILSPLGGSNIIFQNNNLTIYGNLITRGQNTDSWFCPTWNVAYPTAPFAVVAKTITVNGDLDIQGGSLIWNGNGALAQDIVVYGNIKVATLSAIYALPTALNQRISIGGSLINNTNGVLNPPAIESTANCDFSLIPVTFFGANPASITNTGGSPLTIFSSLTVNKGTSQSTTLTIDIGGILTTPADNWLTLQNGTLRYQRTNPGTDFNISTTTPFSIPATSGLYIDLPANVGNRNILIGNAANNNGDLLLNGKLTIVNGNVYIGATAGTDVFNNDIEYTGSGASAIEVQGGNLIVNGQVRSPAATTNGVLNYTQTGGNVIINGNNALSTKAKLEVSNSGSVFNMSGGTLTIVRGGGTTFGDLFIRPGSSSVTGGTIVFSHNISGISQTYGLDANVPLNNLTITGRTAATAANATVGLMVSPLVLNGSLTLSNINSIFNSNNLNVSIKGDLNNNGNYNYGTNLTTFNGGFQLVTGTTVTDFYDLDVSPVNSLTVNNSFSVNRNLTIGSGNLVLGSSKVTLLGDLINNGSYTDNNSGSGISLTGASQQQITGTGDFGRLELNNGFGAKLNSDITLQNNLVLSLGVLDINKNQLTLNQNSFIEGAPFGVTKMIKSDGVISNLGVVKFFTAEPQLFTFPVGVTGKYTPASFTITASDEVGSIGVNPVNNRHSSITDPANALNYYWQIKSSGITGFYGDVLLQYLPGDVVGVESEYVAAMLALPGNYWYKATPGALTDNVDEGNHLINFVQSASNNLTGDYTAGKDASFPAEVPSYRSVKDGNWSDVTVWTPVGSSPPCPAGGPNGAMVIIDHVVTTDINNIFALSTTINNRIIVDPPTFNHNLGVVDGNGTVYLIGGNLPAGNYSAFVDCSGNGTIEYGGTGTYTIIATLFSNVPNMLFTGTGTRILPNKDLTICKRLVIDGPALDNSVNNSKLTILGSMERYNTGTFIAGSGASPASTVSFAGQAIQTIGGITGNFSGADKFNNLEINNAAGLNIGTNGLIEVGNELLLTSGIINTTATDKLILLSTSSAVAIPAGGNATSFVNGPLIKQIINGGSFQYPLGNGTTQGHNFTLTSTAGSTLAWTVECFMPNLTAHSLTDPLKATNTREYWSVSTTIASSAKIKIGWDPLSVLTPLMTENGISDIRVAEYFSGSWRELASVASGDDYNGDVATTNSVNLTTSPTNFTTASITMIKPRASFTPNGPVCGDAGIPVSFTSFDPIDLNYTLDYTINGAPQPTIIVTSSTYTLPTPVPGAYKLTGFSYHNGVIEQTGVVDATIINVFTKPTDANAGSDRSLCGVSGLLLAGNNPSPYSGLWTKVSGAGGTFINNTQNNTGFNGILGKTYTLRWTISNVSCTSSDDVIISFPIEAALPSNFMSAPTLVCQGAGGYVYTVPGVPGNTYNWTYSGTGHTINGTLNSVTIDFGPTATSGILSVTTTNGCGTSAPRTIAITVNSMPAAVAGTDRDICLGASTTLGAASVPGSTYSWSSVPAGFTSTAAEPVVSPSVTTTYTVVETITATGCTNSHSVIVTLSTTLVVTAGNNGPVCLGSMLNLTGPAGMSGYSWTGPDGFTSTQQSPLVSNSATLAMAGPYTVTVTNASGCSGTATTTVIVNDLPTPTLASSDADNMFCEGTSVTFTAGGGTNYDFRINSTSVQNSVSSTYTTTTLADGQIVDVIVTNAGNCSATSTPITNSVIALPTATIISSDADNTFCAGTSVTFTASGGTNYDFRVNNISVQNSGSSAYTTTTLTNGQVVDVTVTAASGCSATSSGITNLVSGVAVLTSSDADNTFCEGTSVTFTASGGTSYNFRVNGTTVQNGGSPAYTTTTLTNGQIVDVMVTSAVCVATSSGITNTVTPSPIPTLTSSDPDNIFCGGTSITFTAGGGTNYNFRVNGTSVQNSGSTTYTTTTLSDGQIVDVIVTNAGNCSATSSGITNSVSPIVTLISSDADNIFCEGTSVTFTASGGTNYNFRVNGSSVLNSGSPTYTTTTLSNGQIVDVVVTNAIGCTATSSGITNTVNAFPTTTLNSSDADNTFCAGTSITFTAGGGINYNFRIDGASVQNSSSTNYTTTTLTNGQTVDVIVTNASSCSTTSSGITNTVNGISSPTLTSSDADNMFCEGTSVTFTTNGGTNYNFRVDGISVQNGASSTYTTTTLTNGQIVDVLITSTGSCITASPGITNTVYAFPAPTLTSSDADNTFCDGASATFTASGGTNYNFRVNGTSVQNSSSTTYTTTTLTNGQIVDAIVTNAGGCSAGTPNITVTINPSPTISNAGPDQTGATMCGITTASLTANTPVTGTGLWSIISGTGGIITVPNSPTSTFSGVSGTAYVLRWTISTALCVSSDDVNIKFNQNPTVSATQTDVLCSGTSSAAIDITAAGGTGPYTYAWTGTGVVQSSEDQNSLAAGTYSVIVTDANSCTSASFPVTITEASALSGSISSQVNVSTFEGNDGSVTVAGSGGVSPYEYKLGSGVYQVSGTFGTLTAGSYIVTVRDINLCTFDVAVIITQPSETLSASIASTTNVACFGTSTGSVTVTGSGGVPPYLFNLDGGTYQSSGTFSNLAAGTYTVTILDAGFSTFDVNVVITQPSAALAGSVSSQVNVVCFGSNTGSVSVAGSGGTSPYNYKLGSGSTQVSGIFGTLAAGAYTITVEDANNCTFTIPVTITQPLAAFTGSIASQINASCSGSANGTVTAIGTGGVLPYMYSLNDGTYQSSDTFSSLAAGIYTITIRDANLCTASATVTITEPAAISISHSEEDVSCPDDADGAITLTITGGIQPYTVRWKDGILTTDRQNIHAGPYTVVVTDKNGCAVSVDIVVGVLGSEKCIETPEIITPNNDGFNDTWQIKNIDLFPDAEVFVFNRWGKLVFKTKNISANPWNGTFKGKLLPTDSYHYILHLNNGSEPKSGVISIIR